MSKKKLVHWDEESPDGVLPEELSPEVMKVLRRKAWFHKTKIEVNTFDNRDKKNCTRQGAGIVELCRPCGCGCDNRGDSQVLKGYLLYSKDWQGFNIKVRHARTYDALKTAIEA